MQGALKVKEKNPQALLLFVTPPSAEELKHRLIDRGTETMDVINDRMRRAAEESEIMDHYQYLVINDDLDTCVKEVHQLIQSEHLKVSENLDLVADIQKDSKNERRINYDTSILYRINPGSKQDVEESDTPVCNSRYSIVLATSKRARQLIAGAEPMVSYSLNKPLSIAVDEVYKGKVTIIPDTEDVEEAEAEAALEKDWKRKAKTQKNNQVNKRGCCMSVLASLF